MTCALFNCTGNWTRQPSAVDRVAEDENTCCQPSCAVFDCAAVSKEAKLDAVHLPASSADVCCVKTCSFWSCPYGYVIPEEKKHLPEPSDERCCQQELCAVFGCSAGYTPNDSRAKLVGHSDAECCNATCAAFTCEAAEGWVVDPAKFKVVASDAPSCCQRSCAHHECSDQWVKTAPPEKAGDSDAECCAKTLGEKTVRQQLTCALHACDASLGWVPNTAVAAVPGPDDASCCSPTCRRHDCSEGWVIDASKFEEELGELDPARKNRVGQSNAECCQPTCSRHECPEGWASDPLKARVAGDSDEECCVKTCALHSCSDTCQLAPKPKAEVLLGETDAQCCEHENCRKWPEALKEALDGCNATSIHDDCEHMFEKTPPNEEGLVKLSRCGYLFVSGEVYSCGASEKAHFSMGQSLPKPVMSVVLETDAGPLFRMGSAEMNGYRPSMEDTIRQTRHERPGAAQRGKELSKMEQPPDDEGVKQLMMRIDTEFLETKQASGSTGTFAFVIPSEDRKSIQLRARSARRGGLGQIAQRLAQQGYAVIGTDRVEPTEPLKGVEFVKADLCDGEKMRFVASKAKSTIHVGAIPGPSQSPPVGVEDPQTSGIGLETCEGIDLLKENLMGTALLFEACAAHGHRTSGPAILPIELEWRVVFSSSLFSMGWSHDPGAFRPRYLPLDEEHPPEALEHYGLSKVFGEEFSAMLTRANSGPRSKRARTGVEALSFIHLRFSNIIKEEKWKELPLPYPEQDVTPLMWAYCHEHDVVEAHLKALELPAERMASRCERFLIVADDVRFNLPSAELAKRYEALSLVPSTMKGYESLVSNKKAKQQLGMSFRSFRAPTAKPGRSFHAPKGFSLKCGESGEQLKLANCILHPTSFDATHPELEFNVGPGKTLDTNKYCVIIVNLLGNGMSSSPGDEGFPCQGTSICDNVRLQALLITKLAMIYGYSMGAMQALHWAAMFPDRVQRVAAVCGSAAVSDFNVVFLDSLEAALAPESWSTAGRVVAHGLEGQSLEQLLQRITARVYLMPCTTDSYFNAEDIDPARAVASRGAASRPSPHSGATARGTLIGRDKRQMLSSSGATCMSCWRAEIANSEPSFFTRFRAFVCPEVGNIGDSRVLLGKADGSIVEGPGTDGGLTTDHKPDHPAEVERIKRTGGHVESIMGVARVNGDLAVLQELLPGPFDEPTHGTFRKAYAGMAERAGLSFEAAVERRFDQLEAELTRLKDRRLALLCGFALQENGDAKKENGKVPENSVTSLLWPVRNAENAREEEVPVRELRLELQNFEEELLNMVEEDPQLLAMAQAQGLVGPRALRRVRIVDSEQLRVAVEAHEVIQWDDRLLSICGQVGKVLQDDPSDNTAQVKFRGKVSASVWLPSNCLIEEVSPPRKVQVAPLEELQKAVEEHPMIPWNDVLAQTADQIGVALKDRPRVANARSDVIGLPQEEGEFGLTEVYFHDPLRLRRWLPTKALQELEGAPDLEFSLEEGESGSEDSDEVMLQEAEALRTVVLPSLELLKTAVEASQNLTWEDFMSNLPGRKAEVVLDHESGSSCCRVEDGGLCWLPTSILQDMGPAMASGTAPSGEAATAEAGEATAPEAESDAQTFELMGGEVDATIESPEAPKPEAAPEDQAEKVPLSEEEKTAQAAQHRSEELIPFNQKGYCRCFS
eukprot:g1005.t1